MIRSEGTFAGQPIVLICDGNCQKAWGINNRPQIYLSCNEDDYCYFADQELGPAPADPGTTEGWQGKPTSPPARHNKWCCRECERSEMLDPGEPEILLDYSRRVYNIPGSEATAGDDYIVRWIKDEASGVHYVNATTPERARIVAAWLIDMYDRTSGAAWTIEVLYPDDTVEDEAKDYA